MVVITRAKRSLPCSGRLIQCVCLTARRGRLLHDACFLCCRLDPSLSIKYPPPVGCFVAQTLATTVRAAVCSRLGSDRITRRCSPSSAKTRFGSRRSRVITEGEERACYRSTALFRVRCGASHRLQQRPRYRTRRLRSISCCGATINFLLYVACASSVGYLYPVLS